MTSPFRTAIDNLIAAEPDRQLMIKLAGDPNPQPIGPGKVSPFVIGGAPIVGLYVIETIAMMGAQGQQPKAVTLPLVFAADALVWLSTGIQEDSSIVRPGGNRSPGGLHLGGS